VRAVLIATGNCPDITSLNEDYLAPMMPLVDRPFIQHIVEYLVFSLHITEFDFILSHRPEQLEDFLGDGTRWANNLEFRFHLAPKDGTLPYHLLKGMGLENETRPVLLGHADRLSRIPMLEEIQSAGQAPLALCCWSEAMPKRHRWNGWGWFPGAMLHQLPAEMNEAVLVSHLFNLANEVADKDMWVEVPRPLSCQTYKDLLDSQRRVLAGEFPGLLLGASQDSENPGVWIGRNVALHPSARAQLKSPVYIGENCKIGAGVQLGPNAVLERDCVLTKNCTVEDALVMSGSFVGEGLDLIQVLVHKNRLINVQLGSAISLVDDFILGSIEDHDIRQWWSSLFSRLSGLMLLIFWTPLLILTALCLKVVRHGPVLHKRQVVRLPAPEERAGWRTFELWSFSSAARPPRSGLGHFVLCFLPALVNVTRGEMRLVGLPARTKDEIQDLRPEWKALYLRAQAGIITEAFVRYGGDPSIDELHATEVIYSVMAGWIYNIKLLVGYAGRLFRMENGEDQSRVDQLDPSRASLMVIEPAI
jgi:lipopolysaccharide/colanic/teichoic acid biosynthesis glycosyltransferase